STFSKWIDLIGGIEFYFDPVVPKQSLIYKRNLGENLMFGEEVTDFLQLKDSPEIVDSYIDRMNFQQSILLSVYDRIYKIGELKKEWILFFKELVDTNLTHLELYSLYKYALKGHILISSSEVPGKLFIEETTKKQTLLVKTESIYYMFEKLIANIGLEDYAYGEIARAEVLNLTGTDGLAKNVKSFLNEHNFNVLSVGNGWSQNEKFSAVIDRSGNPEFTYKIAKILNINKIFHLVDKEVGLDTTVILGEDFEFKTRN
ncbi:MAG: LytR C-terminal domain-containing protein, partial [Leptospiraceae bacterium]|nr:LytR C-terminal domain-containing protein [Leptospiraceae bacterium]